VLAIVRALRALGLKLATLSNSAPEHDEQVAPFADLFDVMHFSHRTGARKPEPEAYRRVLADLGVAAAACVFTDDKARNVEAAARMGIVAFIFVDATQLGAALAALGLPPGRQSQA
jgi:putative hydrolase of the HAD superfamily